MTLTIFCLVLLAGLLGAGLTKAHVKEVFSRTSKKEKILSVFVVVLNVFIYLIVGSSFKMESLNAGGIVTDNINQILMVIFHNNVMYCTVFLYAVIGLPLLMVQAGIIERVGKKKECFQVSFYTYLIILCVNGVQYAFIEKTNITNIIVVILICAVLYWVCDMYSGRFSKRKAIYIGMLAIAAAAIVCVERAFEVEVLIRLAVSLILLFAAAFVMKKTKILRNVWRILIFAGLLYLVYYVDLILI